MNNKVLCVDDDANVLTGLQRNLRKQFDIDTAIGALAALKLIEKECPYAVIVADMQMPGMNGVEFLNLARQKYPDTVRVMLTGNADQKTAIEAVNRGHIFQFLNKPCPPDRLAEVLSGGIKQFRMVVAERELLENTLNGSVKVLMEILALSDPVSFGRGQTVRDQAREVARLLGVGPTWELELAAMLCPIGCVSLPAELNRKARSRLDLTGAEKDALARIPQVGSDLLTNIPRLQSVARIVLYQNKNFDGSGFPGDSVAGTEIPIEARIIRVLTDLAQLETKKSARFKGMELLRETKGRYDPQVLAAVAQYFELETAAQSPRWQAPLALSVPELHAGQVLTADIRTPQEVLLVAAGTRITPLILERLRNFAALSGLKLPIYVES